MEDIEGLEGGGDMNEIFFQAHIGYCLVNKHREIHQEATRTVQCGEMVWSAAGECTGHT